MLGSPRRRQAEAFRVAKDTAGSGQRAVAIWAGAAGVNAKLPDFRPELLTVKEVEAMVRQSGRPPIGRVIGDKM